MCIGARVVLTTNLWTEMGLMNGSMGAIYDITWKDGQDSSTLPSIILIKFDEYHGSDFPYCTPGLIRFSYYPPVRVQRSSLFPYSIPFAARICNYGS